MNSGETGYNKANIEELRNEINEIAKATGENITEVLYDRIVMPMSNIWYGPDAVEFFEGFKEIVKHSGLGITAAFDGFREYIQKAGEIWAENTQGEKPTLPSIDEIDLNLNISSIQPDLNGSIIMNTDEASKIAYTLGEIEEEIKTNLNTSTRKLDVDTSFIGNDQSKKIIECFNEIINQIHNIFKYLTDGDNSLYNQINNAVTKYQSISEEVASAFNNTSE